MKKTLILLIFTILILFSSPFWDNVVIAQTGTLKYYGYYGAPWPVAGEEVDDTTSFTNVVFLSYLPHWSQTKIQNNINHRKNQGHKIILSLWSYLYRYLYENSTISDSVYRSFLNDLKTKLGTDSNKIWAFYLGDEPNDHRDKYGNWMFRHNPERLEKIINITKEIFPDINTFIVFFRTWIVGGYIVNNENFDLIGVDPYFLTKGYENSVNNPFACNTQNRNKFEKEVKNRIYWIKSGGRQIRYACENFYPDCTEKELEVIENLLNSDTDKNIVLVSQSFMCNEYVGTWNISQIPSICQQQWYYDWAKSDPDIPAIIWYKYSSAYYLANIYIPRTNQGKGACLGVGTHVPDMLDDHKIWGLEVLCGNQDYEPFCTTNGISYRNPEQAKCQGEQVSNPGGSGSGVCDSACGASQWCHGLLPGDSIPYCTKGGDPFILDKCDDSCQPVDRATRICESGYDCTADVDCDGIAPGTNNCDENCQISCYDNYFKVYPSNLGEGGGKYGGDNPNDNACCDSDEDCVYQGQCYSDGWYDLDGDGRIDMYCYIPGTYDWWINVDYHTSYCTGRGYHWNVGGGDARVEDAYYTTTGSRPNYCTIGTSGHPSVECCCGDDLGEEHAYRAAYKTPNRYHIAWNDVTSDDACCSNNEKCVFQGNCYDIGTQTSGFNTGGDDNYARCRSGGIHWLDLDYASYSCTASSLNFVTAGESGVGEYGSSTDGGDGMTECCGDDSGEEYMYFMTDYDKSPDNSSSCDDITDEDCINGGDDPNDKACCDDDDDCVYQGTCYTESSGIDLDGDGRIDGWCMTSDNYKGHWRDCDDNQNRCNGGCGANYVQGGESSQFGEYDTGSEEECCGDDENEYYITAGAGIVRCCNNASDCIDANGTCRSGKEGILYDNCNDGIDNDCDNLMDKNDEDCFDPGDLDKDDDVDIDDLVIVTSHFGLKDSDPGWNETADIIENGEIDIYDAVFIAGRFT
ncbi:MAG: hypothetical protein JSW41_01545 [Candidatus Aenigmatarchaeota archaeon]|nr:MAG: hypothetical protein JSW41_01545 [Candidatus Aenigmarchaeota archaeon]